MSDDGNVATTFAARVAGTDTPLRVRSVHLDVDQPDLRRAQLRGARRGARRARHARGYRRGGGRLQRGHRRHRPRRDRGGTRVRRRAHCGGRHGSDASARPARPTDTRRWPASTTCWCAARVPVAGRVVDAGLFAVDDAGDALDRRTAPHRLRPPGRRRHHHARRLTGPSRRGSTGISGGVGSAAGSAAASMVSRRGRSSLVARWAHNPKVVGSNPTPATTATTLASMELNWMQESRRPNWSNSRTRDG